MKPAILATLIGALAIALASPAISSWALGGGGGVVEPVSGDVNGDGTRSISDAVYLLRFLFSGGPAPVEPQEPEASPELVSAIQSAAARIEEVLSTVDASSPARAALTDIIMTGVLEVRQMSSWPQSRAFELTKLMTLAEMAARGVEWGIFDGVLFDHECADRCASFRQECISNCGWNTQCVLGCNMQFVECLFDCNG